MGCRELYCLDAEGRTPNLCSTGLQGAGARFFVRYNSPCRPTMLEVLGRASIARCLVGPTAQTRGGSSSNRRPKPVGIPVCSCQAVSCEYSDRLFALSGARVA